MEGRFIIRRRTKSWDVLLLLSGISFIALYFSLKDVDPETPGELLVFLIPGILICGSAIGSMLFNQGAFICIEANTIRARYHWSGRLDCPMDEVAFVLPQINTLTILLKNGKRHVIMGVENPWQLSSALRRQSFKIETESSNAIRLQLSHAQAIRRKELLRVIAWIVLMIACIFIAVLLTGGREMRDFGQLDWIVFSVMGLAELATLICLFIAADRCGKQLLSIAQLKYRLRGAIIASHPLPSNHVLTVYTDEDLDSRIILRGFPHDGSVYYCVQEFRTNFTLETVHISEIVDNMGELPEEFSGLIDITALMRTQ